MEEAAWNVGSGAAGRTGPITRSGFEVGGENKQDQVVGMSLVELDLTLCALTCGPTSYVWFDTTLNMI